MSPLEWDAQLRLLEGEATTGEPALESLFTVDFHKALQKHTKYDGTWIARMRPVVQVRFADTWYRYSRARRPDAEPARLSPTLGAHLFRVMLRPLELVGPGRRIDLVGDDFTLAVLSALSQGLPVPNRPSA